MSGKANREEHQIVKAVLLKAFRQPIEFGDVDEPPLGCGEALMAIEAAGVCYKDVLIVDGF